MFKNILKKAESPQLGRVFSLNESQTEEGSVPSSQESGTLLDSKMTAVFSKE